MASTSTQLVTNMPAHASRQPKRPALSCRHPVGHAIEKSSSHLLAHGQGKPHVRDVSCTTSVSSYTVTEGPPTYQSHAVKPFPLQNGRRILFAAGCAAESVQPTQWGGGGLNRKKPASYLLLQAVPLPRAEELTTSNATILNTRRFAPRATMLLSVPMKHRDAKSANASLSTTRIFPALKTRPTASRFYMFSQA